MTVDRKAGTNLKCLFMVEIRNERFGGVSPATLGSCVDSLSQAPIDVLRSWFDTDDEEIIGTMIELAELCAWYGKDTQLREFL